MSFIDNGQNNGDLERSFLSMDCELTQLSKNMMVFVDTSSIPTHEMSDFYQASRDRIDVHDSLAKNVISQLKELLTTDEKLIQLNEEYTGRDLKNVDVDKLKDSAMAKLSKSRYLQKMLNGKNKGHIAEYSGLKVVEEEKRVKPECKLLCMGEDKTVHVKLGRSIKFYLSSVYDISVSINTEHLERDSDKVEINNSYVVTSTSKAFNEYLFNPQTMGYAAEEKFTITFTDVATKAYARVHVTVEKKEEDKKERKLKIDGPVLILASASGADGTVSWDDVPFYIDETTVCKIIPAASGLHTIYVNLDSSYYKECMKGKIYSEAAKNNYIENIYMQAIMEYLGQFEAFDPVFVENRDLGRIKADILDLLAKGSEISIRNRISCSLAS